MIKLQNFSLKINPLKSIFFLSILSLSLLTIGCKNDDDNPPQTPLEQLPTATQTGANTFGCLLDGEVFLPGTGPNPLDAVYQLIDGAITLVYREIREMKIIT